MRMCLRKEGEGQGEEDASFIKAGYEALDGEDDAYFSMFLNSSDFLFAAGETGALGLGDFVGD